MTKIQKSAKNLFSSTVKSFLTMLVGIISTPYLLQWLGDDTYGTFKIISDLFYNLGVFELGLTGAIIGLMSKAASNNDEQSVMDVLYSSRRAYLSVLPIAFMICLILMYRMDLIISDTSIAINEIRIAFFIICLSLVYLPTIPYRTYLQVIQRGDVVNWIVLTQLMMTSVLLLIAAYLNLGIIGQASAFSLSIMFGSGCYVVCYKIYYKGTKVLRKSYAVSQEIWQINWEYFIVNIANKLSFYFDNIVVGFFLGPKTVVIFFITQKLPLLVQHNLGSLGNAVWAPLVLDYHRGNLERFRNNILDANKIISLLSIATILPVLIYNRDFIRLWVGEENFAGINITIMSCFVAYLHSLIGFWGWIMTSTGLIKQQVKPFVLNAVINISISIILIKSIGMIGPIIGTAVGLVLVVVPANIWYLSKMLQIKVIDFLKPILKTQLIGAIFIYLFFQLDHFFEHFGWAMLLTSMFLVFSAYCLACWILLFNNQQKAQWKLRFQGIFLNDDK